MSIAHDPLPDHYRSSLRTLLRYAVVMAFLGLLVGLAFQESTKKLDQAETPPEVYLESILPLGLVHGHFFTLGVLMPLAMAGALLIARRIDGRPVGKRSLAWLTRGYLPLAAAALGLQLFKGYHVLLAVRSGEHDLAAVDAAFLGGSHALRFGAYALIHTGMALGLGVFLVGLWRSLSVRS